MMTVATTVGFEDFCWVIHGWNGVADADGAHRDGDHAHDTRSASWRRLVTVVPRRPFRRRPRRRRGRGVGPFRGRRTGGRLGRGESRRRRGRRLVAAAPHPGSALRRRCRRGVRAGGVHTAAGAGSDPIVNYVIDQATFDEQLAAMVEDRQARFDTSDVTTIRCHSADGAPVDPADVVAAAFIGHVRRVVIGSDGVIINLGRRSRLFTGSARDAALLQAVLDRGHVVAGMPAPPLSNRSPPRMAPPWPHQRGQRRAAVRSPQPPQDPRLPDLARPRRHLAHPTTRRHHHPRRGLTTAAGPAARVG